MTAQILAKKQKYVNCGVAIAPVSQWELYGKFILDYTLRHYHLEQNYHPKTEAILIKLVSKEL